MKRSVETESVSESLGDKKQRGDEKTGGVCPENEESIEVQSFIDNFIKFSRGRQNAGTRKTFFPIYNNLQLEKVEYYNPVLAQQLYPKTFYVSSTIRTIEREDLMREYEHNAKKVIEFVLEEDLPRMSCEKDVKMDLKDETNVELRVLQGSDQEVRTQKPELTREQINTLKDYGRLYRFVCDGLTSSDLADENQLKKSVRKLVISNLTKKGELFLTEEHQYFIYRTWLSKVQHKGNDRTKEYALMLCDLAKKIAQMGTNCHLPFLETVSIFPQLLECVFRKRIPPNVPIDSQIIRSEKHPQKRSDKRHKISMDTKYQAEDNCSENISIIASSHSEGRGSISLGSEDADSLPKTPGENEWMDVMSDVCVLEREGILNSISKVIFMVECPGQEGGKRSDVDPLVRAREQAVAGLWLYSRMSVILIQTSSYYVISAKRDDECQEIYMRETGDIVIRQGKSEEAFHNLVLAMVTLIKRGNSIAEIQWST